MRQRSTVSAFLVCVIVAMVASSARPAEPSYQGRSLTKWLSLFREAEVDSAQEKRACEAVRAIGTNAIPHLLRMLTSDDLQWQMDAKSGFTILGSVAAPAVPALAKLLTSTNELDMSMAAQALGEIGAPALPVLMESLTNRHYKVATQAYLAIPALGTNARPAIPILLRDLQHPNHFYRERAADALGSLHIEPEIVVPALTNLLDDPNLAARHLAIQSLGEFGSAAHSAVPAISRFLTNADLSYAATAALREIAPEALANRPSPSEDFRHSLSNLLNSSDPAARRSATNLMRRYGLEQPPRSPVR
jgi:HEAT repeat protein